MAPSEPRRSGIGEMGVLAVIMLCGEAFAIGYLAADIAEDASYGIYAPMGSGVPASRSVKRGLFDAASRLKEHKNVLERSLEDRAAAPLYGLQDLTDLEADLERTEFLLAAARSSVMPTEFISQAEAAGQTRREALLALARLATLVKSGEPRDSRSSRNAMAQLEETVQRLHHHMSGLARQLNREEFLNV